MGQSKPWVRKGTFYSENRGTFRLPPPCGVDPAIERDYLIKIIRNKYSFMIYIMDFFYNF